MNPHSVIQSMQPLSSIKTALDVRELTAARAPDFGDMSPNSHLTGIFSIIQMQINV